MFNMTIVEFCSFHRCPDIWKTQLSAKYKTMQEFWDTTPDLGELFAIASVSGVLTEDEKLRFGLYCCERIRPQLKDSRAIDAVSLLRSWLGDGEVNDTEWRLASEDASTAFGERGTATDAPYGVVASAVSYNTRWEIPEASPVRSTVVFAERAGLTLAEMAAWLRKHTKPNFSEDVPETEYTGLLKYYSARMKVN